MKQPKDASGPRQVTEDDKGLRVKIRHWKLVKAMIVGIIEKAELYPSDDAVGPKIPMGPKGGERNNPGRVLRRDLGGEGVKDQ